MPAARDAARSWTRNRKQFQAFLDLNFFGTVRCTRAAVPRLLMTRGHVVNIGSLAAKMAASYLGAYPVSKFAVAAYTHQLRLELGPQGLHVLLVCPGPIARPDAGQRYSGEAGRPASLRPETRRRSPPEGPRPRRNRPAHCSGPASAGSRSWSSRFPRALLAAILQLWPTLGRPDHHADDPLSHAAGGSGHCSARRRSPRGSAAARCDWDWQMWHYEGPTCSTVFAPV